MWSYKVRTSSFSPRVVLEIARVVCILPIFICFYFKDLKLFLFSIVSILAETEEIKELLLKNGIDVETVADIHPIHVQPSRVLSHIYARLGTMSNDSLLQTDKMSNCWQ